MTMIECSCEEKDCVTAVELHDEGLLLKMKDSKNSLMYLDEDSGEQIINHIKSLLIDKYAEKINKL